MLRKKIKGSYVYIEESFDTIFNMDYGSGKSCMDERVKRDSDYCLFSNRDPDPERKILGTSVMLKILHFT